MLHLLRLFSPFAQGFDGLKALMTDAKRMGESYSCLMEYLDVPASVSAVVLTRFGLVDTGTCILFGDGCGAVVLTPQTGACSLLSCEMHSDGEGQKHLNVGRSPAEGTGSHTSTSNYILKPLCMHVRARACMRACARMRTGLRARACVCVCVCVCVCCVSLSGKVG